MFSDDTLAEFCWEHSPSNPINKKIDPQAEQPPVMEEYAQSKQKEPEKPVMTADLKSIIKKLEILGKDICDESLIDDDVSGGYMPQPEGGWTENIWSIIDDLEKLNASQKPRELTDEEIETEAEEYAINNFVGLINQDIIERIWTKGAKWYRDHPLEPRPCSNCGEVHEYSEDICYVKIGRKT